jgi:hypothetical protein
MRRVDPADAALSRALAAALDAPAGHEDARHPDEGTLARYLTRELEVEARDALERHVAACARCAAELAVAAAVEADAAAEAAGAGAALGGAPPASGTMSAPSRGTSRAERASRQARVERAPRRLRSLFRIAAVLAVVLLAGGVLASRWALGRLQPVLVDGLAGVLSRQVSGGDASLVLAGGPGLRLEDLRIAEDPSFGGGDFAAVHGAVLRLDPGEILRGRVRGAVQLDRPALQLVRDRSGRWNVETLAGRRGGRAATPDASSAAARSLPGADERRVREAKERLVRLTSASIEDGTLEITDRSRDGRELVLRDVELSYASPDPRAPGSIELRGTLGTGEAQKIALRGEIGPFEGDATPRWELDEVLVQSLPLADVPGTPRTLAGELTFSGTLASEGSGIDTVVRNASGKGDLGLCCGELRERNLVAELVAALGRETDAGGGTAATLLERARRVPVLSAALAQTDTPFEDIAGSVAIAAGTVTFDGLALDSSLFHASATGSLSSAGALDVHGTVTLTPAATTALVDLLPEARRLFAAGSELEVPFKVAGRWPDVRLEVDVKTAIARAVRGIDPRSLALLPRVAG